MGCDIHFFGEKRTPDGWEFLPAPVEDGRIGDDWPYRYRSEHEVIANGYDTECDMLADWYDDRDYHVFGVLAGVRRDGPPIAEPRGLPGDACPQIRKEIEGDLDYHSTSWLTLAEMRARADDLPPGFLAALDDMERAAGTDDVRAIFAFDN
jgi:hypothetical protein